MRQLSLIEDIAQLAGALPAIKAAMRGVAGAPEGEGRKALPDKLNAIARASGIKLTGGNAHGISEEMLHKILSPSDDRGRAAMGLCPLPRTGGQGSGGDSARAVYGA